MPPMLIVPLLVVACAIPGALIVALFFRGRLPLTLETGFAALVLGVALVGYIAFVSAEMGLFSPALLAACWLLATLVLLSFVVRLRQRTSPSAEMPTLSFSTPHKLELALLLVWLLAASWLFFRPHEYIMGGADAGVYVSLGAEIAQQGGFVRQDAGLAGLDSAVVEAIVRPLNNPAADSYLMPGFYVTDRATGEITPQFYPLHPVWLAIAFGLTSNALDGISAELLMAGLWALLGTLAVTLTLRAVAGWKTGLLLLAGLSVCALQVWFARYPTTEMLTQFLLWAGLFGVVLWMQDRPDRRLWALVAGVALGQVFLVRIDIIVLLPVLALFVVWLWGRGWDSADTWFVVPLIWFTAHAFVHAMWQSAPYFYDHIGFGVTLLLNNWLIPVVGGLAAGAFLWAVARMRGRVDGLTRYRRPALLALIGAILIFALYGWFVRPLVGDVVVRTDAYSGTELSLFNHENWRRLAWYLSPLGVWLGVVGSCLLLWRVDRTTALILAVGWLFGALYLWNVRANPTHVYVMRRYVPAVVPFLLFCGAYLVGALLGERDRWRWRGWQTALGLILALAWLGGLAWSARGFVSQVDMAGISAEIDAFATELPEQSVLLFNDPALIGQGDIWGTPLRFVYGHETYGLRGLDGVDASLLAGTIEGWLAEGRAVVWLGDPAWLTAQGFDFSTGETVLSAQRLEGSAEVKPSALVQPTWTLRTAVIHGR